MSRIARCLELRFSGEGQPALVRERLHRACVNFVASGWADKKYVTDLTGESDAQFWSCVSEALVYDRVSAHTFAARPTIGSGPDFLLKAGAKRLWIEVICPTAAGVPSDWLQIQTNKVTSMPHEAILLRWTAAIKEKTEKLIGNPDRNIQGYLEKGVVSPNDIYVIAVNGCQLRHGPFPALSGISQFPYAAEAVFPIGPYQIHIDRETLKTVGHGHQQRFTIKKPNGESVPSHAFIDPRYQPVSAVWAVDFNGCSVIGSPEPSALIHNPNAINPLPYGFLAVDDEYAAIPVNKDEFLFKRIGPGEEVTANP